MKKILIVAAMALAGCTTIHFDNGTDMGTPHTEQWHHNALLNLVEASSPVNLEQECQEKEWASVKTELSFLNGLASGIINQLAPLWYPKTVEVNCRQRTENVKNEDNKI